ncbi:hypothetical protein Tco_1176603 [Tanacetum coccineum]
MAEKQTIMYAPQWNNMTVDDVVFQTNNVSTVVAFFPFPSTDEPEKRPLREFLIKFLVLNGQRSLALDFKTFFSTTGLDYNNGKYVAHHIPEVVKKELGKIAINPSYLDKTSVLKNSFLVDWRILFTFVIQVLGGNYSSTKQVNSIQQLLAFSLITRTEVDIGEIIYSDLVTKLLNKSRLKYVSYPRFILCALQVLLVSPPPLAPKLKKWKSQTVTPTLPKLQGPKASRALSKKRKKPKSKKPPTKTKRDIQLASTGLPFILDEGTRKSQHLPESTATHPKDSGGNKQPLDRDITSTTPDERMAKTTPHLEGSLRDKYSGGNIPPANREPIDTPVADPSGTAFLLSDDELDKESDEEEVLSAGDDMDEDPQDDADVRTPSPCPTQPDPSHVQESASDSSSLDLKIFYNTLPLTKRQLLKYFRKMSRVLFNRITKKQSKQHEDAAVPYADLKASIDQYYDENIAHRDQTDKLVEASMSSLNRSSTNIIDLYKGLDVITQLLKDINNVVKDDPATNQKLNEATETFARISSKLTEVLSLVKGFDFFVLMSTMKDLQDHALKQEEASAAWTKSSTNMAWNLGSRMTAVKITKTALKSKVSSLRQDTSEIKSMMVEIYQAFKGQPSSTLSGSVTPTLALTHILVNVKGENATTTATEEPPSHTEGETGNTTMAIPISSIHPTKVQPTHD